jgi:hypothetical protein
VERFEFGGVGFRRHGRVGFGGQVELVFVVKLRVYVFEKSKY